MAGGLEAEVEHLLGGGKRGVIGIGRGRGAIYQAIDEGGRDEEPHPAELSVVAIELIHARMLPSYTPEGVQTQYSEWGMGIVSASFFGQASLFVFGHDILRDDFDHARPFADEVITVLLERPFEGSHPLRAV